jgi:hypothetical protein
LINPRLDAMGQEETFQLCGIAFDQTLVWGAPDVGNHAKALKTIPHLKLPDRSGARATWRARETMEARLARDTPYRN